MPSININIDDYLETIRGRAMEKLEEAGEMLASKLENNLSTAGPPASVPGEYPRRETGGLVESIETESNSDAMAVRISVTAPHARHVEAMRPFLGRTLEENRDEVRRILTSDWGK